MITYNPGRFALAFIWRCSGSVFPRAFFWAVPSAALAYATGRLRHDGVVDLELSPSDDHISTLFASFQYVLGFLCVFRTQQAYGRYIEGALLLRLMRTEWVNAFSSIITFARRDEDRRRDVEQFLHYLMRLMSLLACYTLQSMSDSVSEEMPIISAPGMDPNSTVFLQSKQTHAQRSEIVKQWIQRLVIEQSENGNVKAEPPILSLFFQALDKGASCGSQARNLTDIPFPFAYAQVMTVMLMIHALFTPVIAGLTMSSAIWGSAFTFISVLAFWSTNYIACEIECPFGDDPNDLPLINIQHDMNASLWIQLELQTQRVPEFKFDKSIHRRWSMQSETVKSDGTLKKQRSLFDSASLIHLVKPHLPKLAGHGSPGSSCSPRSPKVIHPSTLRSEYPAAKMKDSGDSSGVQANESIYPSEDESQLLNDYELQDSCEETVCDIKMPDYSSPHLAPPPCAVDRNWNGPTALGTPREFTFHSESPRLKVYPASPIGMSADASEYRDSSTNYPVHGHQPTVRI